MNKLDLYTQYMYNVYYVYILCVFLKTSTFKNLDRKGKNANFRNGSKSCRNASCSNSNVSV